MFYTWEIKIHVVLSFQDDKLLLCSFVTRWHSSLSKHVRGKGGNGREKYGLLSRRKVLLHFPEVSGHEEGFFKIQDFRIMTS